MNRTDAEGDAGHTDLSSHDTRGASPEELARRARAGSRHAFAALVDHFQRPLYRFLVARVGDRFEAEDLCQDAFLRAWEKLDRYDERWRFSTWLYTIAQRIATSRARKLRPEFDAERVEREIGGDDPARLNEVAEERSTLWALATELCSPDQRSALWLRYGEDLSYEELAKIMERPVPTVRVQLFRARRLLERKLLEREAARERPRDRDRDSSLFDLRSLTRVPVSLDPPANGSHR